METGLASIIIPTYNRAHLLADAIRSALAQDYPHKQIIVVDDGSTDGTPQLVSTFAGVEYCYQPNQGQAAARNAGLRRCRGEYVASLDSDDIWDPHFLTVGIAQLRKHGASFVFLNWRTSQGENLADFCEQPEGQRYLTQPDGDWWLLTPAQTRQLLIETCPAPSSSTILRRTAMPPAWNERMHIADDWCLLLDMVVARPSVAAFTLHPHWLKQVHGQNIYDGRDFLTITRELYIHDETLLLQRHKSALQPAEREMFIERQAQYHYNYAVMGSRQELAMPAVLRHFAKAFWLSPRGSSRRLTNYLANYLKNK